MLYLDSSALIKHYQNEKGTETVNEALQFEAENSQPVFTSVLTYAEIHAIIARRAREKLLSAREAVAIHDRFDTDWVLGFTVVELDSSVLTFVRNIVEAHPLRGADAVHLASALWLRDMARVSGKLGQFGEDILFASSDRQLTNAAHKNNLKIFNPEIAK